MGRGDRRTKRGKIWRGSYGKTRPSSRRTGKRGVVARPRRPSAPVALEEEKPPDVVEAAQDVAESEPAQESVEGQDTEKAPPPADSDASQASPASEEDEAAGESDSADKASE